MRELIVSAVPAVAGDAMNLSDNAITAAKIAADAIGASELAADAVTEIVTAILATPANKLGTDASGRVILQPTQTGVTIPTVTSLTNAPSDSSGVTTLLSRIASALTINTGAVTVGTNNDKTGYTASTVSDKTGYSLAADQSAVTVGTTNTIGATGLAAIWDRLLTAITTAGSIGKLVKDYLDAAISSRSTYAGGAVASVTAGVTVTTNNDKTGYSLATAPPTAAEIRTELDSNSTKLASLVALLKGNSYVDQITRNAQGTVLTARQRIYDTAAHATTHGATGLLATLTVSYTADADGNWNTELGTIV